MVIASACSYVPEGSVCLSGSRCTGAAHGDGVIRAMALAFGSGTPISEVLRNEMQHLVAQSHKQDVKLEQKERLIGKLERRAERITY